MLVLAAPVAQLDRVPGFEPGGRRFESCRGHHLSATSGELLMASHLHYLTMLQLQFTHLRLTVLTIIALISISSPALAHEISEDNRPVAENVGACVSRTDRKERNNCFATLCEPSYKCTEAILAAVTEHSGSQQGILTLHDIMTEKSRFFVPTDAHELAHVVGRQTARHFGLTGDAFLGCGKDFYYGCQHGFFEIALARSATPTEAATGICEQVTESQRFFCYHGVGHGLMMAYAYKLPDVLSECDKLPTEGFRAQGCYQGTFMENVNSYLRGEARQGVFDPNNLLAPCNQQEQKYQWECYANHAGYLVTSLDQSLKDSAYECLKADKQQIPSCITSLGQFTTNPAWQQVVLKDQFDQSRFYENAVKLCSEFPPEYIGECHNAAVKNLLNYEQFDEAHTFCSLIPATTQRDMCYLNIASYLSHSMFSSAQRNAVCAKLPENVQGACEGKAVVMTSAPSDNRGFFQRVAYFFRQIFSSLNWSSVFTSEDVAGTSSSSGVMSSAPSTSSSPTAIRIPAKNIIRYKNGIFKPSALTIDVGESVLWINDGGDMWPASNDHPTHEIYSEFDPGKPIPETQTWTFTFTKKGEWKFHNHVGPMETGVVHVR